MCQALGITEEDYWTFCDLALERNGERREGYELIPDIRCEPATTTAILVNLAIGLALTAVSVLLTPKPRAPSQRKAKEPPRLQTADATGPKRFATQAGFNNVQSVASLGNVIPLVFADFDENTREGGVRVASNLLWSRMTSWGTTQQFEGIYLFSSGPLAARPEFEGFAIGDSLITSYPADKLRLIFGTDGGRPSSQVLSDDTVGMGQYPNTVGTETNTEKGDAPPFSVYRPNVGASPDFCGTRTPSSQTQFGAYAPMPNGMAFQLPYELVMVIDVDGTDAEVRQRAQEKRRKIRQYFYIGAAVTGVNGPISQKGSTITYEVTSDLYNDSTWGDWGNADIRQSQETRRVEIDSEIGIGSSYLVGSTITTCTAISPQEPFDLNTPKTYTFTVAESSSGNSDTDLITDVRGESQVYEKQAVQRLATATISNSRPCNITEIGIRSNVWKQINFANVNTEPSQNTIEDFQKQGGDIQLGRINKYITRYSIFMLQVRVRGGLKWTNFLVNKTTGEENYFCIKGSTPQDQYNYLFIEHPLGQYEFRLVPVSGNSFYISKLQPGSVPAFNLWQLRPNARNEGIPIDVPGAPGDGEFRLYFSASPVNTATPGTFYNKEWVKGQDTDVIESAEARSRSFNPFDALADYIKYDGENSSHASGPEHEVVYVNEIIYNSESTIGLLPVYDSDGPQYDNLAIAGLNLWSDKEWSSLSELSAFMKYGVQVTKPNKPLGPSNPGPTNLLPEIVYTLLTDNKLGAGSLVGAEQVDDEAMANAAAYCRANGFTWNGVLTDSVNLREWIFENAAYCLLDFTIIGGKFALRPTPMLRSNGEIDRDAKPPISALFTDGNIRDLKVVFLDPEQRKAFKAVCLYREDTENGFPETRAVTVSLNNESPKRYPEEAGNHDEDPEETFDMTQFCSVKPGAYPSHPVTFAMTAIRTRTLVTHSVTFQTTPEMAMGLIPGQYFRLVSEATHTSRFNNGAVSDDGVITSTTELERNRQYDIYKWTPGTVGVTEGVLFVGDDGNAPNSLHRGIIFTLANTTTEERIYKVESLTYADDGLVELTGSHVPLTETGALAIMDNREFDIDLA
nr:hypothetical protein 14 [bacterium]